MNSDLNLEPRIALYGATGVLGRLVARELVDKGCNVLLAGRNEQRLAALAREHRNLPFRVARIDEPEELRALLADSRVLLNCASPSAVCGEPLLQAALNAGTHYADASGEQGFMRTVFERYDAPAGARGIAVVPALGFDYAPGDCLAGLAAKDHQPADEVVVAYSIEGSGIAGNSVRFAAETPGGDEIIYRDGAWRPLGLEIYRGNFEFGPPVGRQPMARYGSGEVITVPRHTRTRRITTLITARSLVPHPALVPLFPLLRPGVTLLRRTPARRLLAWLLARLPHRPPQTTEQETSTFSIVALAKSPTGLGRAEFTGHDVHGVTAACLAWGARQMTTATFEGAGVLAPTAAFRAESLLDHLSQRFGQWRLAP